MRLQGKVAVITGGASGFGEGIARRFGAEGAAVVIGDINEQAASALCDDLNKTGCRALAVACDVSDAASVESLCAATIEHFGRLDIAVNNAGMAQINQPMLDVDEQTFDRIFAVNVKSIYLMAKSAIPHMRKQGGGVIINTASTAGVRPRPGLTWYNGSKGAVITLTKSMAVELAPDNIRVNALNPVAGGTPMLAAFMGGEVTDEMKEKFVSTIPLGRLSTPRDMANAALYLASDEADFITGVCLEVDGGRCI
ncbi:MAG TPA: SDR family oxidoreductase [Rhizobiales bacterium]|nr:SDR family oxidoreductase [Hyphomicrobiales bacterium]